MNGWLVRGIGFALVVVIVRAVLGFAISTWPLHGSLLRILALVFVILVSVLVGFLDGRRDRLKYPDPERGTDLTILYLKAAVLGGLVAGALAWIIDQVPTFDLGDNALFFEMTSGAAFVVLLIFLPGMLGVTIGRWLAGRKNGTPRKEGKESRAQDRGQGREKKSRFRSKSKAAAATPVAVGSSAAGSEPVPEPSQGYFAEDDSYPYSYEPESSEYRDTADERTQTWEAPPERR